MALAALQIAQEDLGEVEYHHPNIERARKHVAKALDKLTRRLKRLEREAVTPKVKQR